MRLLVQTGIEISAFSFLASHVNAPRGTDVAMVGIRASCQPMPELMRVAPARLSFLCETQSLLHAETMLFVDDDEREVAELHSFLKERVGADHDLHVT